jgi:hypothetical protein
MSQGWIAEEQVEKSVPLPSGTVIPQATSYYKITAAGIDKIEGPGDFTMDKFKGIKIEATGQNIITVGDGNQVNAQFKEAAGALIELKRALLNAKSLSEEQKLDAVADIDSIESQLAARQRGADVTGVDLTPELLAELLRSHERRPKTRASRTLISGRVTQRHFPLETRASMLCGLHLWPHVRAGPAQGCGRISAGYASCCRWSETA